jgi:hypothetical protein
VNSKKIDTVSSHDFNTDDSAGEPTTRREFLRSKSSKTSSNTYSSNSPTSSTSSISGEITRKNNASKDEKPSTFRSFKESATREDHTENCDSILT